MMIEMCIECDNPTGKEGECFISENSLYIGKNGPYCAECFEYCSMVAEHKAVVEKLEAEVARLKEETKLLPELTRKAERFTEIWDIATQSRSADAVQSMEATWKKWEQLRAGTHIPMEQALIMKMELAAEVERLKAHTWEQERAAVVAWLRLEPSYQNRPWAVITADIERGEHWPEGGTS